MKIAERNLFKASLHRLAEWERLASLAQDAYDNDSMSEDCEEAVNHYYDLQYNEFAYAVHLLCSASAGALSETTCARIVNRMRRREE